MRLLVSGGNGKFCNKLIEKNKDHEIFAPDRYDMDITNINSVKSNISKFKPDIFLHAAALTRPMVNHVDRPHISIKTNIIGTGNVCLACMESNLKLVYISTDYVYPGTKGDYREDDPLLPVNEYAWSKLGGECAVRLYKNSLIIRTCMTEKPFVHTHALVDCKKSMIYIDDAAEICLKILNQTGIINLGGSPTSPYEFVKKDNEDIGKIYMKDISDVDMAEDSTMNIDKLKKALT